MTGLRTSVARKGECRESVARASVPAMNGRRESVLRATEVRLSGIRQTDPGETGARMTALREIVFREIVSRAEEVREKAAVRTDLQERGVSRESAVREAILRARQTAVITAVVTTVAMAALMAVRAEVRATGRTEDSSSQEEAADRMEGPRETDKTDFREAAGRVLWVLQVTAGVRALVRVLGAVSTVVRATAEALAGREVDSGIINRARALLQRLRARMWRRSARKKRDGLTARRKASAPGKTISMRRMRQPGRSPAGS